MEIEFDPAKSARNEQERGLPFEGAAELEWHKALVAADDRHDYGETRYVALVPMAGRLYLVCYCIVIRFGLRGHTRREIRRIISFRKANKREERLYEQASTPDK
jgi:uncharacterized DUF497 family protein